MKLIQLRYFITACRLNSITKAAEALFVSQPAVTASIHALEKELGVSLLYRSKKAVMPTEAGELLLRRSQDILQNMDDLTEEFASLRQKHTSISVGIPPMIGYFLFPKIFSQFITKYPQIKFVIQEAGSENAKQLVKDGKLDLALITMGDVTPPALTSQIIGTTELFYCVGQQHPLAGRNQIAFKEIGNDPLILFSSGYFHRLLLEKRFAENHLTPNILFHSNQLMTIKGFVANNLAGAFLLPQVITPADPIVKLSINDPMSIHICVIWRKDSFLSKEVSQFIAFTRRLVSNKQVHKPGKSQKDNEE